VYPLTTPGGWHIIGRTEARMFDASRSPPSLLAAGDSVRFVAA
jgi:allophanate hydrolase subunit 1